jgi:predicted metalloprotease with PDZ domain
MRVRAAAVLLACVIVFPSPEAEEPVRYRFSFPEPQHHWMQVETTYTELGSGPLELRMSRSSPGRYALHDFAKNVYDVHAFDASGQELETSRPDPYGWTVTNHGGAVTVRYKVFGDRVDGTYLAIDATHAHINMPAAVMWARGLDDRAVTITFDPPGGERWQVATQLHPGGTAFEFGAPNLQYLMDSPAEFGPVTMRTFSVSGRQFRLAVHHTGTEADVDALAADIAKIIAVEERVYGELPAYEPGHYTFIADALPWANGDAMEHRNSTIITTPDGWREDPLGLLESAAHEFFHGWNAERIRPRSLEPFDFERANMSDELWLAEGFTQYYGDLALRRAGLVDLPFLTAAFNRYVNDVVNNPARLVRSAVEMSRMATFTDEGRPIDRTNWSTTVISYYPFGAAIALGLDLTLRERSGGTVTLDDFMRAMWRAHGSSGGSRPGYVARPYTMADAEARLAEVSRDAAFAREFFSRYISGHDVVDYRRLFLNAGLVLRAERPGTASLGQVRLQEAGGSVRIAAAPPFESPLYAAGLNLDDYIRQLDGQDVRSMRDVAQVLARHKPGDTIAVVGVSRAGTSKTARIVLSQDPGLVLVPIEETGGVLTPGQKTFRESWLN